MQVSDETMTQRLMRQCDELVQRLATQHRTTADALARVRELEAQVEDLRVVIVQLRVQLRATVAELAESRSAPSDNGGEANPPPAVPRGG